MGEAHHETVKPELVQVDRSVTGALGQHQAAEVDGLKGQQLKPAYTEH